MLKGAYLEAKLLSDLIAAEIGPPRFHVEKKNETESSEHIFGKHPMVQTALGFVQNKEDDFGHGISHVRKVAVDAGAIVMIEKSGRCSSETLRRLILLAHLAAALHDIRREERDHALRGAETAQEILKTFELKKMECTAIAQAISNHEAFKPARPLNDPSHQLLSDALYDADKFRWGPDNFTETVWMMVARMRIPFSAFVHHFNRGLKGIEKIKGTFRTSTGREYGPDFIDRGLAIGRRLYTQLQKIDLSQATS